MSPYVSLCLCISVSFATLPSVPGMLIYIRSDNTGAAFSPERQNGGQLVDKVEITF